MMNLNLVELVNQTSAEFEEKFEARNLKMIMNLPTEPATIYADGRRMWRVLANVFNNAAKYAMEGSRVYVDLVQTGEEVQLTIKNVSEQPLNISADELTERFIRGDVPEARKEAGLVFRLHRTDKASRGKIRVISRRRSVQGTDPFPGSKRNGRCLSGSRTVTGKYGAVREISLALYFISLYNKNWIRTYNLKCKGKLKWNH